MKKVLIVVSSYAPAMIADMQRARLLAWELPAYGWDVEILAPDQSMQDRNCIDDDATAFFVPDARVHYAPPLPPGFGSLVRSRTIGWRALLPMYFAGRALLARARFDLVYFSTTQFNLFLMGPRWLAERSVPYVIDIHDPIYRPGPGYFGGTPPGLRRKMNQRILREIEKRTTRLASALISVSPKYLQDLDARHEASGAPWRLAGRREVIPFAASVRDLQEAGGLAQLPLPIKGEIRRIIYVGAGGPVMARAFTAFCRAVRALRGTSGWPRAAIRVELYGTMLGWREGEPRYLQEIAESEGTGALVVEEPRRVTYRHSLELLLEADGVLVLGVDNEGYMPSKLYTYALSGKPLLGIFLSGSVASNALRESPGLGHVMTFDEGSDTKRESAQALLAFLGEVSIRTRFERRTLLLNHLAPAMAHRHAQLFDACIRTEQAGEL
ncbi:MAG: glycosyltransferase [Burkholderiales bacterium]|nr:glycosyltransferase [Burkholderiales bacterium]